MHLDNLINNQSEALDSLLSQSAAILEKWRGVAMEGDRIDYFFVGDITFRESQNNSQDITFQIPQNTDFYGTRLMLQPFAKFVTIDQDNMGPDELNFRPVVWSTTEGVYNSTQEIAFVPPGGVMTDVASLDCMVSLTESIPSPQGPITRSYQNIPTPVQMFYGGGVNYGSGSDDPLVTNINYFPNFEIPQGLLFPIDLFLPKGSALTLKIAPTFAQVRQPDGLNEFIPPGPPPANNPLTGNRETQYQIRAFLQGYKIAGSNSW
jgi:hypothetical protein